MGEGLLQRREVQSIEFLMKLSQIKLEFSSSSIQRELISQTSYQLLKLIIIFSLILKFLKYFLIF